jgi:PAS domain S-box-containing protein
MFEYEEALTHMYKGATYAPLISWDISCKHIYGAINTGQELQCLKTLEKDLNWVEFPELRLPLLQKKTVVITNLNKEIIWVSRRFYHLTGYLPAEAVGKKPNFLQGSETCKLAMGRIRENLKALQPVNDELVNYRKDGQPYLCKLQIYPVFDKSHAPVNFVAIESAE